MKVITVYSLKGGSGKTTLSLLMAQYLVSKGYRVSLIDSDTDQKSLSDWANNNGKVEIDCYLIDNALTKADLSSFQGNTDFVIIDGTPRTNNYIKEVLSLSDYVLIPVQPTQIAVSSLIQDNHLSMLMDVQGKNPNVKIKAVLNGVTQHNQKAVQETRDLLEQVGLPFHSQLGLRKAFIIDYDKPFMQCNNSKALNELGYLVDKLMEGENE